MYMSVFSSARSIKKNENNNMILIDADRIFS